MKKFCIIMACIFGIATIVLYISSIYKLDSETARSWGASTVVNMQGTVFCAATAIMCVINIVGAMILSTLEKQSNQLTKASALAASSALEQEARTRKVLDEGGWKCPQCGSINQNYVSSCGCGMTKREALNKQA